MQTLVSCLLVTLLCFLDTTSAHSGLVGACYTQNYTTADIIPEKYLGTWYEIGHSASFYWDEECYCTTAQYLPGNGSGGDFTVVNSCNLRGPEGKPSIKAAVATIINHSQPGRLNIHFGPLADAPYDVIEVGPNYEWALAASCSWIPFFGGSNIWILSRTPTMDPALFQKIYDYSVSLGFDMSDFIKTDQDGCWNNPPPVPTPPGPLPPIDGCYIQPAQVSGFDMTKFFGTWHIIVQRADWIEHLFTAKCICTTTSVYPIDGEPQGPSFSSVVACNIVTDPSQMYSRNLTLNEIAPGYDTEGIYNIRNFNLWNEHWQILAYDPNYEHALLYNCFTLLDIPTYCWYILSRGPTLDQSIIDKYLTQVKALGLIYDNMAYIPQNCSAPKL